MAPASESSARQGTAVDVFSAFPHAIITGEWEIGKSDRGTLVGRLFKKSGNLDVIIDDGESAGIESTPETLTADMLVYCRPEQLPTTRANALVSGYMLHDKVADDYYEIIRAGIGKNQHTGTIEHIELELRQTEVMNGDSKC